MHERTDENLGRDGFRQMKEAELIANQNAILGAQGLHMNMSIGYKYVLDPVANLVIKQ